MRCRQILVLLVTTASAIGLPPEGVKSQLDVAPTATQKPYSPADEQVCQVTPPPFIWVPVKDADRYALQVSRTEAFDSPETQTFGDIHTSVFVPGAPLPPGRWYWRYGVPTEQGDVFGRARPFVLPEDARPFPFPEVDQVIARVPTVRPRLFFPGQRLQQIRAAATGPLREEISHLVETCRRMVGQEIVPEPPRPKSGPEKVQVMRTTRPPMDEMEQCALAYLLTGDRELGMEARRRLLHFFAWDPKGTTGLWSYDEPAMWVMMRGIRAYDWTHDLLTPEDRAKIEPAMRERAQQFYVHLKERRRFETSPYESHAGRMPGFLSEAALCFAHEWPEARGWLEYATLLYYTSYPAWGGDDGGWQEGPSYWSAYMSFALHYVVALRAATGVDLMNKPFFRNTPYYALYTATPYHEHRPFGDAAMASPKGLGQVLYAFSSLLEDPYLRWYAEASEQPIGRSLLTLATYAPELKPANPGDLPHGRVFPSVGLAATHTALGNEQKDITFLLRSSPFGSASHGHGDQNAFVIEAFGRALAPTTGYYPWYGSPHHDEWTRATRSVNSILVDGQGQAVRSWDSKGRISAFQLGDGYDYLEGDAAEAYGGRLERFRRQVVHVRPGVFVIRDDLIARKPATFQWLLHAVKRIAIDGRTLTVTHDPAVMRVHVLLPTELSFEQTDRYTPEPEPTQASWTNTWHLTASTTQPLRSTQFLSVLLVHKPAAPDTLPTVKLLEGRGAVGVRLTAPDGREDWVGYRTDAGVGTVTCGPISSDAAVFAEGRSAQGTVLRELRIARPEESR